jgi:hypothetical protein
VDSKRPESELDEFFRTLEPWVAQYLRKGSFSEEGCVEVLRPDGFEVLLGAEDRYRELLKKFPDKLRQYREWQAAEAARSRLSTIPCLPVGAPRGMRFATRKEAEELQRLIDEFEQKKGTRREPGTTQPKRCMEVRRVSRQGLNEGAARSDASKRKKDKQEPTDRNLYRDKNCYLGFCPVK